MNKREILTIEEIQLLVNSFYEKVRADELLGPVFEGVIQDRWTAHLEKMYRFWQTVLLSEHTYYGAPFPPHAQLPVGEEHFTRWVALFNQTIDVHFKGEKAVEAKWRAEKMAQMFQIKLNHRRTTAMKPLI